MEPQEVRVTTEADRLNREEVVMVTRLHKLEDLNFRFGDRKVSGHILSHVWFPESTEVEVGAGHHADLPEAYLNYPTL